MTPQIRLVSIIPRTFTAAALLIPTVINTKVPIYPPSLIHVFSILSRSKIDILESLEFILHCNYNTRVVCVVTISAWNIIYYISLRF